MTAKDIQRHLEVYYFNGVRYLVSNVYFFGNGYCETDLLVVKDGNGYVYDIEIKISRGDFIADKKKLVKHNILEHGNYLHLSRFEVIDKKYVECEPNTIRQTNDRPHRFYYCVPYNLIKVEEVPHYAGLLYVCEDGTIIKKKESKLLHKEKIEVESRLCMKFYHRMKAAELKK